MHPAVAILSRNGHRPGAERSLAGAASAWLRKHEKIHKTIVFPGCGCGSYELALLDTLGSQAFETVVMIDNDVHKNDEAVWRGALGQRLVVLHSFRELCSYVGRRRGFNVVFFHKAKEAVADPCYKRFIDICSRQSGQRNYVHAFRRDGKDCVFASAWDA